ncbi:YqiA/YcfP family alpha/beta fold hydrolase [Acinetobacter sp. VNK23]|nr:YqiA/YcfP family alpha/beta fold hydrolase [Acinetobacter thutiue]MDM1021731.1 YqiA/YcfP family alpha/beta fold hydrolase [Acinetobacter thutiue]
MKWDRNYVREKYGISMLGIDGIFFPAKKAKRLLVFFSSMGKDRYDRYSWFWDEDENWEETSYLFLKDDSFHYFLGTDEKKMRDSVKKVINYYQNLMNIEPYYTYMLGVSMGGYAAIYFAFYTKARAAIVANPQVTFKAAQMHQYQNWERHIREMGTQWVDLDVLAVRSEYKPAIYLEYGSYPADKKGAEYLIKALIESNCLLILRKEEWSGHTVNSLFKNTIEATILFFENEPLRLET